jgi:hypothetical protein
MHSDYADRIDALKAEVADLVNVGRHLGSEGDPTQANAARNLADLLAGVRKSLGHASVEAARPALSTQPSRARQPPARYRARDVAGERGDRP